MDKSMLIKWKSELETQLSELEKKIATSQLERTKVVDQVGAVSRLLSSMNVGGTPEKLHLKSQSEAAVTTEFLSKLEQSGWSVEHRHGRTNIYGASRGGDSVEIWIKFSVCHEATGKYWFGISPDGLKYKASQKGGVVLMLGVSDRYLCFPFSKLYELLKGATETRTGQKFQIQEKSSQFSIQPGGTNNWIDVSASYNDLSSIGL